MISNSPIPWFDFILTNLSISCDKFKNHYEKNIPIKYKHLCYICKKQGITHMHHIIPRCELGAHAQTNLIELCPSCHKKVEWNSSLINKDGKYFYWGIKKKRKIARKCYKQNIEFLNNDAILCFTLNFNLFKLLIKKHVELDSTIKQLITCKEKERLMRLIIEWKNEGLIKNIPEKFISSSSTSPTASLPL